MAEVMVGVTLTENKVTWVEKLKAQEWKLGNMYSNDSSLSAPPEFPVLAPLAYECEKPEDFSFINWWI